MVAVHIPWNSVCVPVPRERCSTGLTRRLRYELLVEEVDTVVGRDPEELPNR